MICFRQARAEMRPPLAPPPIRFYLILSSDGWNCCARNLFYPQRSETGSENLDIRLAYVICHHRTPRAERLRAAFRCVTSGLVLHLGVELTAEQDDQR
jgi:hypothetical protein